ncbi:MAG: Fe-S metabolism protein SufE [Flavobacteriaceae bacterium]|jgi:cysteine desulfuration protein SufE|nr:Fe-S metabolism protein SufE [Flavobacteriaceae bacterium]MBR65635.1 Fe-S metabolism protein SufE [Flavobacteriaceae bacterium]GIR99104.1 MAG: Fe-S metabolism protein SufE [Flavobacteriaceae bacterium]|tara:strand:- start:669 stop:1085 length:417 start_codon:yes stop_codon:yes gene_type:complete
MTIENAQKDIIDNFLFFDDWTQKYEYIIELSKDLEFMSENLKNEDNLIKGCQSKVWLHAEMVNGKINFLADSEAIITKGIISILLNVFNNRKPQEILDSDMGFIEKIGLKEHLSPNRANGLSSMYKQIKFYALAFSKS